LDIALGDSLSSRMRKKISWTPGWKGRQQRTLAANFQTIMFAALLNLEFAKYSKLCDTTLE
jgi:hypothetical protein